MNKLRIRRSAVAGIVLTVLLFSSAVQSQQYLATISGTVKDASGAVVKGVQVRVTSLDTSFVTVVTTK